MDCAYRNIHRLEPCLRSAIERERARKPGRRISCEGSWFDGDDHYYRPSSSGFAKISWGRNDHAMRLVGDPHRDPKALRFPLSVKHWLVHHQILPQAENELFNKRVGGALLREK